MIILLNELRRKKDTVLIVNGVTSPFLCEAFLSYSYAQSLSLTAYVPLLFAGLGISLLSSLVISLLLFRPDKPSWNPSRREEVCTFVITTIFPVMIPFTVLDYVEGHSKRWEIPIVKISPYLKRDGRRCINAEWCYAAPMSEEFCKLNGSPRTGRNVRATSGFWITSFQNSSELDNNLRFQLVTLRKAHCYSSTMVFQLFTSS